MGASFELWWDYALNEPGKTAWNLVERLVQTQGSRRCADADDYLALYFGSTRYGVSGYRASAAIAVPDAPGFNMIQAFTDSLVATVVRNKVRPFFMTEKGSPEEREQALGMTRVVESELRAAGLYDETAVDIAFDGHLFDVGCMKWTPDFANQRIEGARVFPWEILIPEREQRLRMPRQWVHVTAVDRGVLSAKFADNKEAQQKIEDAQPAPRDAMWGWQDTAEDGTVSDLVLVAELHHLPSGRVDRKDPRAWGKSSNGKDARKVRPDHDGRRMLVLQSGEVIDDSPWPFETPPYAMYRPMKKPTEWWSRGVPETLFGAQIAVHRMNTRVDAIMHLHARPLLYVWRQAQLNTDKITNDWATILEGNVPVGQAIQHITAQSVPAEYMGRIRELIAWAKEQLGLSDQTVQANRPPGIEHAPALQFLHDLENVRQHPRLRAWETFYTQSGARIADALRMLVEYVPDYEAIWSNDKELQRIKWKAIDLGEQKTRITNWPTDLLPQTPGAKMSRLIEMIKTGMITPQKAMLALASNYPDIEAMLGDANAFVRNIDEKLNRLVKDGDVDGAMPHAMLDLELAKTMVKERANALEADGADQTVLDHLETWLGDVEELLARGAQFAAAQQLPAPGADPGPAPPPIPPGPDGGAPVPAPMPNEGMAA